MYARGFEVIRSRSNPKGHRRKLGSDNRPFKRFLEVRDTVSLDWFGAKRRGGGFLKLLGERCERKR